MTSSLRRKRRTTRPAASILARTAASLVGLGLFLSGASAFAQDSSTRWLPSLGRHSEASASEAQPKTLYFSKDPAPPLPDPPPPPAVESASPAPAVSVPPAPVPASLVPAPSAAPAPVVVRPVAPAPVSRHPEPRMPQPTFGLQQTAMQKLDEEGKGGPTKAPSETGGYEPQLEPPGPHRLFRLESERSLFERMRQEALTIDQRRIEFPTEPDVGRGLAWEGRHYPPMAEVAEPSYVCYDRLYFEDLNSERYGWDLGFIQPLVSTGIFFKDLAMLPYHAAIDPCRRYECNTGYCLPGDPVPYAIYPPGLSVTGLVAEGAAWVAIAAMFP